MRDDVPTPTLMIDGQAPTDVALRHVWSECVGAGRANEALRADWQAHFREAVKVLGARYVRFHGLFHDDMFVYRTDNGGGFGPPEQLTEPVYTFAYVDKVFDAILDTGARPFVELGFMPRQLATQTETVLVEGPLQPAQRHGRLGRARHRDRQPLDRAIRDRRGPALAVRGLE